MQKIKITCDSLLDAILALAKRLRINEERYHLSSEDFFDKYTKGLLDDRIDFVEWSGDYQNFLSLKLELEDRSSRAA